MFNTYHTLQKNKNKNMIFKTVYNFFFFTVLISQMMNFVNSTILERSSF